jgi:polyhydroxyalkanoate synthesis regulator phasin
MTLDELQQGLADLANSGDPVFANAAAQVNELTEQAKAGQLSTAELKEILEDMQRQMSIINEMSQLAFKERLNTILTGLITIASAV